MSLLFDSFNARNLRARDVADAFVVTDDFFTIRKNRHAIILGPRGSGKTTLLKMLTGPAYARWQELNPETPELPFTGVYIPTDIHWHHQLLYGQPLLKNATKFFKNSSVAAVNTAVQIALAESFATRLQSGSFPQSVDTQFADHLISAWNLPPTIPKLPFIVLALKQRVVAIGARLNQAIEMEANDADFPELPSWYFENFMDVADSAIVAFDTFYELPAESRWALCFDELELAPPWLQQRLFKLPRSASQKILLKISSSPNPDTGSTAQASPSEDYDLIKLWRPSMVKHRYFCAQLAQRVMARKGLAHADPEALFGASEEQEVEDASEESSAVPYSIGSDEWQIFREVALWDESLAQLLREKGLDPSNPEPKSQQQKDAVLRKIKPIVYLRHRYSKADPSKRLVRRSRKAVFGFCGVPAIYDLSDGNPRRLIRLVESLCDSVPSGAVKVTTAQQSKVVLGVSYLFRNYIEMIPGAHLDVRLHGVTINLYQLLREIGRYFSSQILLGPFPLDPPSTFIVDEAVPEDVVRLLRIASYHGAIVRVDKSDSDFITDLRGGRFRLCFTLAPIFPLPLRVLSERPLSECLKEILQRAKEPHHDGNYSEPTRPKQLTFL